MGLYAKVGKGFFGMRTIIHRDLRSPPVIYYDSKYCPADVAGPWVTSMTRLTGRPSGRWSCQR